MSTSKRKKVKRIEPEFSSREESADYSRFENYELISIDRKKLKNAPYNPRIISDEVRRKLLKNIKRHGLQNPPVWNPTTGNIVSGHQRVDVLDTLEGTKNYRLRVAAVVMTEREEKEQNIFFNNPDAQGDWDMVKLEKLLSEGIEVEETGFDLGKIFQMFGESPALAQPERLKKLSDQIRKTKDLAIKLQAGLSINNDVDFFLCVVFKDYADRKTFTDAMKLPDNRYVDGKLLLGKLNA